MGQAPRVSSLFLRVVIAKPRNTFTRRGLVSAVMPVDTDMTSGRGKSTISPEVMADAVLEGSAERRQTVGAGLSRRIMILNRLLPDLVRWILARN